MVKKIDKRKHPALAALKEALTISRARDPDCVKRHGHPTSTTVEYELILQYGLPFDSQTRPKGVRRSASKQCFLNALTLSGEKNFIYTEGIGFSERGAFPVQHAWCIDQARRVVDPTWDTPETSLYIGVPLDLSAVTRVFMEDEGFAGSAGPILNEWVLRTLWKKMTMTELHAKIDAIVHPEFRPAASTKSKRK